MLAQRPFHQRARRALTAFIQPQLRQHRTPVRTPDARDQHGLLADDHMAVGGAADNSETALRPGAAQR